MTSSIYEQRIRRKKWNLSCENFTLNLYHYFMNLHVFSGVIESFLILFEINSKLDRLNKTDFCNFDFLALFPTFTYIYLPRKRISIAYFDFSRASFCFIPSWCVHTFSFLSFFHSYHLYSPNTVSIKIPFITPKKLFTCHFCRIHKFHQRLTLINGTRLILMSFVKYLFQIFMRNFPPQNVSNYNSGFSFMLSKTREFSKMNTS